MTPKEAKSKRRSLTFGIGLALCIIWLIGWYVRLDGQRTQALTKIVECPVETRKSASTGVWDQIKDFAKETGERLKITGCPARVSEEKSAAQAIVTEGMIYAVLAMPLLFIVGSYASKALIAQEISSNQAKERETDEIAQRTARSAAANREAAMLAANHSAKVNISRTDFIKKLGVAEEYLMIIADPKHQDESLLIKQSLTSELRDIVAKHPLPELTALIRSDEAIQFKLKSLSQQLREQSVKSLDMELMLSVIAGRSPA